MELGLFLQHSVFHAKSPSPPQPGARVAVAHMALEVISFALEVTLIPILFSLSAPKKDDQTTAVRMVLGETLGDLSASLSGNVPGVALWDERGRSIGIIPGTSQRLPPSELHRYKCRRQSRGREYSTQLHINHQRWRRCHLHIRVHHDLSRRH